MSLSQLMNAPDSMMHLSPDGFAVIDADETIAEANEVFCRLLGGRRENLVGRRLKEIGGIDRVRDAIARHICHMKLRSGQGNFEIERRVGVHTYLLRMRPLFDSKGRYRATAVCAADVSCVARKSKRVQQESALRGEILSWLSHRAKEPMDEVAGALNQLYETGLSSIQFGHLEIARKNIKALDGDLSQVENFCRLEADNFNLRDESFDLEQMLSGVVDDLRAVAKKKGTHVSLRVDDALNTFVCGDEGRLRYVVATLARYASDHCDSGSLRISAEAVGHSKDCEVVRFEVRSRGTDLGQNPEEIFGGIGQIAGRGLGLLVARRIVELMGGGIGVHQSGHKEGTLWFFVRLRNCRKEVESTLAKRSPVGGPMLGGRVVGVRVLIVDDDALAQAVLTRVLSRYGYTVDSARGLGDASKALEKERYHVVLMATEIDKQHFDSARAILARAWRRTGAGAPSVVGLQSGPGGRRAAAQDAVATLRKPVRPKDLLGTLDRCLSNRLSSRVSMADSLFPAEYRDDDFEGFEVLDKASCLSRLAGNAQLLEELTTDFITRTAPSLLAGIDAASRAGDLEELGRRGHALCGSAAAVGAVRMSHIAAHVERMCRTGALEEPKRWAVLLKSAFRQYVERTLDSAEQ